MWILKLAWRNIWRNKRRTVITTLSIVVAVFLSAVTRSTQEGQYENMIETTVGTFTGYIQVHGQGYWDEPKLDNSFVATDSLMSLVRNPAGVTAVVPRIESYALAAGNQQSRPAMIMGIDTRAEKLLSKPDEKLESGRFFKSNSEEAVVVGKELMKRLEIQIGDSLVLLGGGFRGMTAAGLYPVVGSVSYPSPEINNSLVFLPIETAQSFFVADNRVTSIAMLLENPAMVDQMMSRLKEMLPRDKYEVMDWREMMPQLVQAIQADRGSGIIILLVLYVVVGFGILGTVLMMIKEREFEFGVMISIGTHRFTLARILAFEILFISLLGSGIGILLSLPIVYYFHFNPIRFTGDMSTIAQQYGMEPILKFSTEPSLFLNQAVIIFVIALVFSLIPVIRASQLHPIKAMRA